MNSSTTPASLIGQMEPEASSRFGANSAWAAAAGVPKETLSRLRSAASCDLRTLAALAKAIDYRLSAVPDRTGGSEFGRDIEDRLLRLVGSGSVDPEAWRTHGDAFFMAGLAVMLASSRGFDRERYLRLGEALHTGISTPEVFLMWLGRSPLRPARFLPMARKLRKIT